MSETEAAQVESMQMQIATLKREKLRIFKAFCNAHAALKNHPDGDTRSEADIEGAELLIACETGETLPYRRA